MMANSTFEMVRTLPSFQAAVMGSLDGISYHMIGQCFWVDEGLVSAAHVVDDFPYLCIYRDDDHKVNISSDRFIIGDGDYAVCRDPTDIVQKLGLSKAKFSRLAVSKDSGVSVHVVAFQRRSIGFLQTHPQFGYVTYTGSTIKGFSGAPYYFGRMIFGMHLGSGSTNIGYDAAFLRAELQLSRVIKKDMKIEQEDSAEWLLEQFEIYGNDGISWELSPYSGDEYRVKVANMYHIISAEVMDDVLEKRGLKVLGGAGKSKRKGPSKKIHLRKSKKHKKSKKFKYSRECDSIDSSSSEEIEEECIPAPRSPDPEVALVQGMLSEWGKTSICKVGDLPKVKRNVVEFKESLDSGEPEIPRAPKEALNKISGNLIGAPPVDVGAHGMGYLPAHVRKQNMQTSSQMECEYPTPLVNYHMESRQSMPVQQNVVSISTSKNKRRRLRRQQEKNVLQQYVKLYGPLNHGEQTSQKPMIPTVGSI